MPDDSNGVTYSFDVCSQCKSICCMDAKPPLTEARREIISRYLEKQNIRINQPFSKEQYSFPAVDIETYCQLFDKKTGKCRVHVVKPETCVSGPVTFDINLKTKQIEWFLKKEELCAYAGVLYKNKATFREHLAVAKNQIIQLVENLSADELRAIVKIEEPQTFKIGEDELPLKVARKLGI